jgi:hypothetical protein
VANKHVIIALKHYSTKVKFSSLLDQVSKYRNAFLRVIQQKLPDELRPVDVVAILRIRVNSAGC